MPERRSRAPQASVGTAVGAEHLPRLPRAYVARHRLWTQLDSAAEGAATLVVGPGGAGKTLGVAGWLRRTGRTSETAWVRADTTWTPARLMPLLGPERLVVVDDAHRLPLATVRALDARLDVQPESLRLLLISRWDLPFTRLSAELLGNYTVLRGELLRLDEDESTALVAAHVSTEAAEIARAISSRTQGWCGAVVMTARSVAAAADPVALARQYAEEGLAVADRVASDVFATLRPPQRHLLLCVGAEPVVTPGLAVHLTRDPQAGEALAELEAMGLLVTRLPATEHPDAHDPDVEHQARYAIHPLLAEVARRRTAAGGEEVRRAAATVQRAVRLDVDRGATEDAFRRLVAIGDHHGAADLLATVGVTLLLRGQAPGLNAWAVAHPSAVDLNPGCWLAIALDRWLAGGVGCAQHWLDRALNDPMPETTTTDLQRAAARLMRGLLGLESIPAALEHAREVLARDERRDTDSLGALLRCQVAIAESWLGRVDAAAETFSDVLQVTRSRNLDALTVVALSHLAFTELLSGREATAAEVADQALALSADRGQGWRVPHARARAHLARDLARFTGVPVRELRSEIADEPEVPVHPGDPLSRFWSRILRSRLELARRSLAGAERALASPIETPELPERLWCAHLLERAFLATLAGDGAVLAELQELLDDRGLSGETAFVAGLRADLRGDRRGAAARFEKAAAEARCLVPPVRALALVGAAQLRDELGEATTARELMRQAVLATEVRRNAVPFLGWTRHGTPVSTLLDWQARAHPSPWCSELLAGSRALAGVVTYFGPSTAAPGERVELPEGTIAPVLSPRERDVLHELARGSTYADIAANLFVSENTVKTHVSSLYGKLSVNRRSAALAAARSLHLL